MKATNVCSSSITRKKEGWRGGGAGRGLGGREACGDRDRCPACYQRCVVLVCVDRQGQARETTAAAVLVSVEAPARSDASTARSRRTLIWALEARISLAAPLTTPAAAAATLALLPGRELLLSAMLEPEGTEGTAGQVRGGAMRSGSRMYSCTCRRVTTLTHCTHCQGLAAGCCGGRRSCCCRPSCCQDCIQLG